MIVLRQRWLFGTALALAAGCGAAEGARAQVAPADPPAAGTRPGIDDPLTPLSDIPGMEVDWPDLGQPVDLDRPAIPAPEIEAPADLPVAAAGAAPAQEEPVTVVAADPEPADPGFADQGVSEQRYRVALTGVDEIAGDNFALRFDTLSALKDGDGDPANIAQINRRAREDVTLVEKLLRIEGYYDGLVTPIVGADTTAGRLRVELSTEPGPLYRLGTVALPGIEGTGSDAPHLRETFGLSPNDPANQDDIVLARAKLETEIGEVGYPFAKIGEADLLVDHDRRQGDLTVPVTAGGRFDYGAIVIRSGDILGAKHVQQIARFRPGDRYKASDTEDLRRALIATGLVSRATLTPVRAAEPGRVDLALDIDPAPPRTVAGEIGYGTGEGFRVEASWEHRNLFPPEGALTARAILGTQEQLAGLTLRRNNFRGRDRILTFGVLAGHTKRDAYDARTFNLSASFERKTTLIFQKEWTWAAGADILYTSERALFLRQGTQRVREHFYIGAISGTLSYDGTDDLLDPSRGFRLAGRLAPEVSLSGDASPYVRAQIDASTYRRVNDRVVLAGRVRLGTIAGASIDNIAPSRRNYAGGGGSVRGYGYQRIGPLYASGDPIGGRGLAEFSAEARVRLKAFGGNFGLVPFIDAGTVSTAQYPDFSDIRVGAGVGLRYYSNFGPIRIDVGTPLDRRDGDGLIAVYVSLGQAF